MTGAAAYVQDLFDNRAGGVILEPLKLATAMGCACGTHRLSFEVPTPVGVFVRARLLSGEDSDSVLQFFAGAPAPFAVNPPEGSI
jgi:hypothetical protein